jgi:threonyl-tRNA synthetase
VGAGLPLFTPRGTTLRELLGRYSQQLREKYGFERVWTPHITKNELYKKSGHWDKFGEELFLVESQETSDEFVMKPMNCPHHIQIYNRFPKSYKDLPVKYMENTTDYRDEKSGELHGLSRVRSLTQDDSHAFVTTEQIEEVATELVKAAQEMYGNLGMELKFRLSFRDDSDAYLGEKKLWDKAQEIITKIAKENKLDYYTEDGEAAFYGPKIDFIAVDAIGREWQVATVQLDFVQPERFELEYIDSDGEAKRPVMIHCALLGTFERFLSVYIEHTAGRFPFWLAPQQIRILTVNDEVNDYVEEIRQLLCDTVLMEPLRYNELRIGIDDRNESLGKKIREAEVMKIPVMLIVGPKDMDAKQVSVRTHRGEEKVKLGELKEWVANFKD